MPHAGAFPFAYCAKAIQCLAQEHSYLLIAPRAFNASRGGIPICLSCRGHLMPSAGAFPLHIAPRLFYALRWRIPIAYSPKAI
jgi:hypothetical protein